MTNKPYRAVRVVVNPTQDHWPLMVEYATGCPEFNTGPSTTLDFLAQQLAVTKVLRKAVIDLMLFDFEDNRKGLLLLERVNFGPLPPDVALATADYSMVGYRLRMDMTPLIGARDFRGLHHQWSDNYMPVPSVNLNYCDADWIRRTGLTLAPTGPDSGCLNLRAPTFDGLVSDNQRYNWYLKQVPGRYRTRWSRACQGLRTRVVRSWAEVLRLANGQYQAMLDSYLDYWRQANSPEADMPAMVMAQIQSVQTHPNPVYVVAHDANTNELLWVNFCYEDRRSLVDLLCVRRVGPDFDCRSLGIASAVVSIKTAFFEGLDTYNMGAVGDATYKRQFFPEACSGAPNVAFGTYMSTLSPATGFYFLGRWQNGTRPLCAAPGFDQQHLLTVFRDQYARGKLPIGWSLERSLCRALYFPFLSERAAGDKTDGLSHVDYTVAALTLFEVRGPDTFDAPRIVTTPTGVRILEDGMMGMHLSAFIAGHPLFNRLPATGATSEQWATLTEASRLYDQFEVMGTLEADGPPYPVLEGAHVGPLLCYAMPDDHSPWIHPSPDLPDVVFGQVADAQLAAMDMESRFRHQLFRYWRDTSEHGDRVWRELFFTSAGRVRGAAFATTVTVNGLDLMVLTPIALLGQQFNANDMCLALIRTLKRDGSSLHVCPFPHRGVPGYVADSTTHLQSYARPVPGISLYYAVGGVSGTALTFEYWLKPPFTVNGRRITN